MPNPYLLVSFLVMVLIGLLSRNEDFLEIWRLWETIPGTSSEAALIPPSPPPPLLPESSLYRARDLGVR